MDPIEKKHREMMRGVAEDLGEIFKGYGFALLVFDMDKPTGARMNYISNAAREDMLVAMREFIAKHEGRAPDQTGHA